MNLTATPTDPGALRTIFATIPQSVVALAGLDATGDPKGLAASSFTTISLAPPLVSVAMAHTSTTWPTLRRLPRLGISLLSDAQETVCRALSAKTPDRFAGLNWQATANGAVLFDDAVATMECCLVEELPAGDHTIALLHIEALGSEPDRAPLVFHGSGFRRLAVPTPAARTVV